MGPLGLLFCVFLFAALAWLLFHTTGGRHYESGDEAMAILRSRYARGEMSKEDFETAVATLRDKK
jgi:uncharacterized membrane protein